METLITFRLSGLTGSSSRGVGWIWNRWVQRRVAWWHARDAGPWGGSRDLRRTWPWSDPWADGHQCVWWTRVKSSCNTNERHLDHNSLSRGVPVSIDVQFLFHGSNSNQHNPPKTQISQLQCQSCFNNNQHWWFCMIKTRQRYVNQWLWLTFTWFQLHINSDILKHENVLNHDILWDWQYCTKIHGNSNVWGQKDLN